MPVKYSTEHVLMTVGGSIYDSERWSFSIRAFPTGTPGTPQLQTAADTVAEGLSTAWLGSGPLALLAGWTCDLVKFAYIGTDGKYVPGTEAGVADDTIWVTGARSQGRPPSQLSNVITLETGVRRGLAHYGRCYLPCLEFVVDATGRLTQATALAIATAMRDWLADIEGNDDVPVNNWAVFSALKTTDPRSPVARAVTGIGCGRVVDTMQSRRTSLDEDRQSVAGP